VTIAVKILGISIASMLFLSACGKSDIASGRSSDARPMLEPLAPIGWADAAAGFSGPDGDGKGYIVFKNAPGAGVIMRVDVKGLTEGWHAIHLHQIGDCSDGADGFKASGGHVNPDAHEHGLLNANGSERADLPNIFAGADGRATAEIFNGSVALYPSEEAAAQAGPYPLIDTDGFAVIIHASSDDHVTQPIGGAGKRVACAAIVLTE
jgi:superoxide dismutase, Cu-Zn family